jgi:flagellar biosynthesis regulator FlaF
MGFDFFSKQNPPIYALRIKIFQWWHSLHKVASSGTVSSYKGVRHLFSKSLAAVQSYSKLAKESIDGGRDYFRMGTLWVSIVNDCGIPACGIPEHLGASVGKAAFHKGVDHLIPSMQQYKEALLWSRAIRCTWYFFRRQVIVVCVQYARYFKGLLNGILKVY